MTSISLQEALNSQGVLSADELNALIPQTVAAVLALEGAEPGKRVGSWEIVQDEEGHRGFSATFPSILSESERVFKVLQLEPSKLLVAIKAMNGELEVEGYMDFRPENAQTAAAVEPERSQAEDEESDKDLSAAELLEELRTFSLSLVTLLLNADLFAFLRGDEVKTMAEMTNEIRADFQEWLDSHGDSSQE